MEHIIQFGITIDDDAIKKNIEANALAAVVEAFTDEMKRNLPKTYYGNTVDWRAVANSCVTDFVERNRDEIMDIAADRLVEKVMRTKAWREKYGKALEVGQ